MTSLNDKQIVKEYFNATGFDRWRRIYGEEEVSKVQLDIRQGHQQTLDQVLGWLSDSLTSLRICDAGCGVGSLSIPLAQRGATVFASDISQKMVEEAQVRAQAAGIPTSQIQFGVGDLAGIRGDYDVVICLDVLIHYPQAEAEAMLRYLAARAQGRIIVSFAPKTLWLSILKKIGEFFPGPSKTTRAYQHRYVDIVRCLVNQGFTIKRTGQVSTSFYYTRIIEAVRD
ncbi:MAG: magnesium protoporphyrin IX methyltransferase [Cyanobacteria bacterium P01_H01_bin.15]